MLVTDPVRTYGSPRLVSLDAFRGLTIAGMIVVNNPGTWGAVYPPLKHAEWHGWTPTDLIFPFFLFIVGVSIVFSFSKRLSGGATIPELFRHVAMRSVLLFALGMLLTGLPDFNYDNKLILDVLQRIAVVYLVSAGIILVSTRAMQATMAAAFLAVYWLVMFVVPVPGHGAGVLEWQGSVWDYADRLVLDGWHSHAEGILSLIPSFSTVLLGSLTGEWLRTDRAPLEKLAMLFVAGNVGMVAGLIMDVWFPINKLLWSPSYVVFTAGFALNVLGMCFWLIDIKAWKRWSTPFLVFGMNPLATFFLASLVGRIMGLLTIRAEGADGVLTPIPLKTVLFNGLFASWLSDIDASLVFAVAYTAAWWGIMTFFYRKKIFLKL